MAVTRKFAIAGVALATLAAAGAFALADSGHGRGGMGKGMGMDHGMGKGMSGQRGGGMGMQDPAERLAAAKTELAIKPEQTAAWDTYAKIVTEIATGRRKVHEGVDRDAVHAMKPDDRQAFRNTMMKQRDEARAKVKAAAETLVVVLDDTQKARARTSLPGLAEEGSGHGQRHSMSGDSGRGHGGHQGGGIGLGEGRGPRWNR